MIGKRVVKVASVGADKGADKAARKDSKRNAKGKLEYVDEKVKKWPPLDIDLVNFFDFVTLLKELGYREYKTSFAKKRASKRYSGRRRKHILRDEKTGTEGAVVDGPEAGGGVEAGHGFVGNTMASSFDIVGEELDSDYEKPYEYESEAFNSPVSDDDKNRTAFDAFNEETEYGEVEFKVGQTFITMKTFKNALKDYFVYEGKDVMYLKNEKKRVRAACAGENCPWLILTSWNSAGGCYQVKTLVNEHNCARDFGSNLASREWVTSKLVKRLLTQPELKPKQAREYMIEEYNVHLSEKMISRGLKVAREIVIGNEQVQYEKLRDYLMELHRSNPGSTAMIDVIPQPESLPLFDKLYISLDACKRGFIAGCRPLIGLDGCFLKGYYGGQLLSAVGQDANNHFFVIAYAVVPNECKDTWGWFLSVLKQDLGDCTELGLNFISDQQKGLALALKEIFREPHHRNCVLYLEELHKHFKDEETKQLVWECARCTTHTELAASMEKLK
ncbi:uncharacterized protein LOC130957719 [Arachis stenosperma]|uniref:uncharacterized protein LOC130957719 n=1 Tax=Arachis stenosperma TaxID=217475 RepID=UPI0025AD71B5|nr:uncharacterized protein LOC130957719 [Arachis stenosperma]